MNDPVATNDDTRLAGLEKAYALSWSYKQLIDFKLALFRNINRRRKAIGLPPIEIPKGNRP